MDSNIEPRDKLSHERPVRETINYMIGGLIAWGLIGWGLDLLLDTRWLLFVGALLGALAGFNLARYRQRRRSRESTTKS